MMCRTPKSIREAVLDGRSVETVLLVDGVERKLKRTYYEHWSTKRGSAEKSRVALSL